MNKRIEWIDIARGILIIFIVLGHTITDGPLWRYLFSFHVPAFFFLSGYCYVHKKQSATDFLSHRFCTIMIPYFVFSLFSIIVFSIGSIILPSLNNILDCNIKNNILCMIYGNSKPAIMKYNQPLWFLPCLFCVYLLAFAIEKLVENKSNILRYLLLSVAAIIGVLFCKYENIALPWHFETAISMLVWFEIGNIFRNSNVFLKIYKDRLMSILIVIGCLIIGYVFESINIRTVGVRNEHYGIIPYYYISAFASIIGYFGVAIAVGKNKILSYIGQNTICILGFHKFPIMLMCDLIGITKNALHANGLLKYSIGITITIVTLVVSIIVGEVINRICPWAVGRRKR